MKRILITGAGSYIGSQVKAYLGHFPGAYTVSELNMHGEDWRQADFRGVDAILHTAGIVHREDTKHNPAFRELYETVNRDLPAAVAEKAKREGVRQFLFLSTQSVYGLSAPLGKPVVITENTPLAPVDLYGSSKAEAEARLLPLSDANFRVAILRPPIVYGKGCKGNYRALEKFAAKLPAFPKVENGRSMIYIENLCELIRQLIEDGAAGIFCPQNDEYTNTSRMVAAIAREHGRHVSLVPGFTWALKLLSGFVPAVNKAFGSLQYDRSLSAYGKGYCVKNLAQSIAETER